MKITITTLVIIEDNEVQDIIHSLNEDPTKAKQEIIDQVNNIYGNEKLTLLQSSGHPGILRDNTLRMPRDIL